jgi:hypothetical protein
MGPVTQGASVPYEARQEAPQQRPRENSGFPVDYFFNEDAEPISEEKKAKLKSVSTEGVMVTHEEEDEAG